MYYGILLPNTNSLQGHLPGNGNSNHSADAKHNSEPAAETDSPAHEAVCCMRGAFSHYQLRIQVPQKPQRHTIQSLSPYQHSNQALVLTKD